MTHSSLARSTSVKLPLLDVSVPYSPVSDSLSVTDTSDMGWSLEKSSSQSVRVPVLSEPMSMLPQMSHLV